MDIPPPIMEVGNQDFVAKIITTWRYNNIRAKTG
jgi:hypothetical protein